MRDTSHDIASRDLLSPVQATADTLLFVVLSIATGIAYHEEQWGSHGTIRDFIYTGLTIALIFAGIERVLAARRSLTLTSSFDRLRDAAQVWSLAFAGLLFSLFALKAGESVSRGAVLLFYLAGLPVVGLWRVFSPPILAPLGHRAGYGARECIVIGDQSDAALDGFGSELRKSGFPAPTIMRVNAGVDEDAWPQELARLVSATIGAARSLRPGEIFLCAGGIPDERLSAIERLLSVLPRAIYVLPDTYTAYLIRCKPATIGTHVAVEVRREPLGRIQRSIKRVMDFVLATIATIVLSPFLLGIALAVKLDSPGPAIFRQTRLGYRGKPFRIFKYRTMFVQEDGPEIQQASRDDARVTRVGRFLRRSSLDELLQLFNVITGEMSLVGPRPHAQAHDDLYSRAIENYEVRQHVKPGLTGWAQVHGLRGETKDIRLMYKRIEFDLWYAVNASLLLDCEILVRTVLVVFRGRNAY